MGESFRLLPVLAHYYAKDLGEFLAHEYPHSS